jgi:hypothetical protein
MPAGDRGVEFACEPRSISAQNMQLSREACRFLIGVFPPLDRGGKRVKRECKAFIGGVDGG